MTMIPLPLAPEAKTPVLTSLMGRSRSIMGTIDANVDTTERVGQGFAEANVVVMSEWTEEREG